MSSNDTKRLEKTTFLKTVRATSSSSYNGFRLIQVTKEVFIAQERHVMPDLESIPMEVQSARVASLFLPHLRLQSRVLKS